MTQTQAPPPGLISSLGVEEPGLAASLQAQSCSPSSWGTGRGSATNAKTCQLPPGKCAGKGEI